MASDDERAEFSQALRRRVLQLFATLVVYGILYFGAAGSLSAWRGWAWIGTSFLLTALNGVVLFRVNPEIIAARSRMGAGVKGFEKPVLAVWTLAILTTPLVAGLEARLGHGLLPAGWTALGLAATALGMVPITWAMSVNRHLETTVRIQEDRGHAVVTGGPYRWVRHPMYVGVIVQSLALPPLLGSAWAIVPMVLGLAALVVRTALEDRTLRVELPGYAEYAAVTRHRLVPGVW